MVLSDGPTQKHFENFCRENHLCDFVRFAGYVEDVENYLPFMDVFCMVPNKNEGLSNSILEAMATGKPVIATDIGGNVEVVAHNETGFIIPPDNFAALVEFILKLHSDTKMRLLMGQKARKRAEEEAFSLSAMIKKHEDLYEEVFNAGHK